ncbi:MAG: hypothetical protein HY841_14230 [Bacteroidetes bacterium]|nr:hypothetical protein [Bacteroidota bacterium]
MKTNFNIGDKVSFLNEQGSGVITNILSNFRVLVTNEDGFEVSVSVDEIVPVTDTSKYKMDSKMIDAKEEKDVKPPKLSPDEIWEVDLHLREILDTGREISDHEKLLAQLKYFRKCMDAAIVYRIKKIIFIHGVGKGTLKQEIIHALKSYERTRHYDAPHKKYGFGAITVEIS